LSDLERAVVDARQHFGRVAGHDHIDNGGATALFICGSYGWCELIRIGDPDALAAKILGNFGVIQFHQIA
jgi:hypothetical protein